MGRMTQMDRTLAAKLDALERQVRELRRAISLSPLPVKGATGAGIEEAPEDGTPYVRQDAGWVSAGAGGLEDAPVDGQIYVRRDGAWLALDVVTGVTVCLDGTESTVDVIILPPAI